LSFRGGNCADVGVVLVDFLLVGLKVVERVALVQRVEVAVGRQKRFRGVLARFVVFLYQMVDLLVYDCDADVLVFLALARKNHGLLATENNEVVFYCLVVFVLFYITVLVQH
jgi:hypothetical protein